MSDTKVGELLKGGESRDAVHIALAPVVAAQILAPGDHVGLVPGSAEDVMLAGKLSPALGIIDPFLLQDVQVGERCWLYLYQQTITSLRHVWEHPVFKVHEVQAAVLAAQETPLTVRAAAEKRLREFASNAGYGYWEVLGWLENGGYTGDHDTGLDIPAQVWADAETVLKTRLEERPGYFRCAC